ncbi:UNVERIFIED_ORG: hypothetical protein ABIB52_000329 [Arthrobacter sp. UYCu721]
MPAITHCPDGSDARIVVVGTFALGTRKCPGTGALPVVGDLVPVLGGREHAYPPGPREKTWQEPRPVNEEAAEAPR